ncbi:MAG: LON peptidase substrate-binding domain-containing protein [Anaerolineales bacterium]
MRELPLFPLQSVLFPGMPLRLHVFEPRYRLMIRHCLQRDSTFGVALIADGCEANGPLPTPHRIGCVARISYLEPLGNGRSNLLAIGGDRIQIGQVDRSGPYLTGRVEPLQLQAESLRRLEADSKRLRSLFQGYLSLLAELGVWRETDLSLPHEPLALVYTVSAVLQVPRDEKQDLLRVNDASTLFEQVGLLLRRETALLQSLSARGPERLEESASLN